MENDIFSVKKYLRLLGHPLYSILVYIYGRSTAEREREGFVCVWVIAAVRWRRGNIM